jgi:hypothetical protein
MALTQDRMTKRRSGDAFNDPVAASTTLFAGALVCLNAAGNAVPGSASTTLVARGIAVERVVNSGSAGDERVETIRGCFPFKNSASGDLITRADIGKPAYIVDDQTVAKTDGTGTRSAAGLIIDLDDDGVWVDIGKQPISISA